MQYLPPIPGYIIHEDSKVIFEKFNRVVSQHDNGYGYKTISLMTGTKKNRKPKSFLVHRLIAQTFIPNPENKPCVHHIDNNKSNNHVSNLQWVTVQENVDLTPLEIRLKSGKALQRKDLKNIIINLIRQGLTPRQISTELEMEIRKVRAIIRKNRSLI